MSGSLLARALRERGGPLGELARDPGRPTGAGDDPARLAAAGPRIEARHREEYELLLEMILEGSILHSGALRVVHAADPDLALLLGDQLYALGLSRLAALGDLEAVAVLADVISLTARASAQGEPETARKAWLSGARSIGWGAPPRDGRLDVDGTLPGPFNSGCA